MKAETQSRRPQEKKRIQEGVLLHKNIIAKNTASLGGGIWLQATQTGIVNEGESSLQEDVLAAISQQRTFLNFRHSASTHKSSSETISTSNSAQFVNNTIAENQASISGGGLFGISSSATVINSIFWGNDAPENSQVQGSAYITYSTAEGGCGGTGNIDFDPEFEITDDYLLQASSPAIDAGNPDSQYEDMEDPNNPGSPLSPAQGTLRNDMGEARPFPFHVGDGCVDLLAWHSLCGLRLRLWCASPCSEAGELASGETIRGILAQVAVIAVGGGQASLWQRSRRMPKPIVKLL